MKSIIALFIAVVAYNVSCAETYQIKALNTDWIKINGDTLKVGDTFNDPAEIQWQAPDQCMKVMSDGNKILILTSSDFKHKKPSISDFIKSNKSATVRAGENLMLTTEDQQRFFSDDFVLVDTIRIMTHWKCDSCSYYMATACENGLMKSLPIPFIGSSLTITKDFISKFPIDSNNNITLKIDYIEREFCDTTCISNCMNIHLHK